MRLSTLHISPLFNLLPTRIHRFQFTNGTARDGDHRWRRRWRRAGHSDPRQRAVEDLEVVARGAAAVSDEGQARGAADGRPVPPKVGFSWFIAR